MDQHSSLKQAVMQAMSQPIDCISINYVATGLVSNSTAQSSLASYQGTTTNAVYSIAGNSGVAGTSQLTPWDYMQNYYYPQIICQSYPVYLQQKFMDKGKQAFEILKALMDKKIIDQNMKVKDFVEAMDTILKTL